MSRVWLNGESVGDEDACVWVADRGFLYGDGLFETFRINGGHPCLCDLHLARLQASADFFSIPFPAVDFSAVISELAASNGILDGAARITLTRGGTPAGPDPKGRVKPTVLVTTRPLPPSLGERKRGGVAAKTLFYPLRAEGLTLQAHKTLGYLSSVHALGEVEPGEEPLLETTGGNLSEGATANLFWIRRGALYTPSLATGCLPGVARRILLDFAGAFPFETVEGEFGRQTLLRSEEAFLLNSVMGVLPVTSLNGREIGLGRPGHQTARLSAALEEKYLSLRNYRN